VNVSEDIANPNNIKAAYPDSHFPNASTAVDFLTLIAARGLMTVATISPHNAVRSSTYDLAKPTDIEKMRSFIAFNETAPANVYYVANRAFAGAKFVLPGRDDIDLVRMIVLDFDPERDKPLEEERDRLRGIAANLVHGPLPPRAIVDSGGGMQVVYQLLEPIELTDSNRKAVTEDVEALMKALARALGADTKTCTVKNLFRIPGTFNWPSDAKKAAGRERSVSGIWFTNGPKTSLEDLRALATIRPEDIAPAVEAIDFGEVDEHAVLDVFGAPERLPGRIKTFLEDRPGLMRNVLREADSSDTSKRDYAMADKLAKNRMAPGDMLLTLAAYGHKIYKTFEQERLFSYLVGEVRKALANNAPERFFNDFATAAEEEDIQAKHRKRLARLHPLDEAEFVAGLDTDEAPSLIKGLLNRQEMSVIYGKSGTGKTFVAIDIARCIALGIDWNGHKVVKAAVIYVAAESPRSVRKRVQAHINRFGASGGFYGISSTINMYDPQVDIRPLLDELSKLDVDIGLIVFDTLARVMIGGNENSTQDMSQLIANGDRLRDRFGCNVMWVHHTGKDESLGARGSSALRAATDTEIEIANATTFRVTKSRDGELFDHEFRLEQVPAVTMKDGTVVTSCIVKWLPGMGSGSTHPKDRNRDTIIRALRTIGEPATVPDIWDQIQIQGWKLTIKMRAMHNMMTRSCRLETERFFTRHEIINGKKPEIRYGLYEWSTVHNATDGSALTPPSVT